MDIVNVWVFAKNPVQNFKWRLEIWPVLNANSKHRFWPDTHIELSSELKLNIHFRRGRCTPCQQKCILKWDFLYKWCLSFNFSDFLIHIFFHKLCLIFWFLIHIFLYKRCLIFWLQIRFVSHFVLDWSAPDPQKMQSNQFFVFTLGGISDLCKKFKVKKDHHDGGMSLWPLEHNCPLFKERA